MAHGEIADQYRDIPDRQAAEALSECIMKYALFSHLIPPSVQRVYPRRFHEQVWHVIGQCITYIPDEAEGPEQVAGYITLPAPGRVGGTQGRTLLKEVYESVILPRKERIDQAAKKPNTADQLKRIYARLFSATRAAELRTIVSLAVLAPTDRSLVATAILMPNQTAESLNDLIDETYEGLNRKRLLNDQETTHRGGGSGNILARYGAVSLLPDPAEFNTLWQAADQAS